MDPRNSNGTFRVISKGLIANDVQIELSKWNITSSTLSTLVSSQDTSFISLDKFTKLPGKKDFIPSKDEAIIGTVINARRIALQGREAIMWELFDLKETKLKLMIKHDTSTEAEFSETGVVWAILNPKLKELDPQYDVRLAEVNDSANLMKIGKVLGLMFCKGTTSKGSDCKNMVYSPLQGEFCKYHLQQATKRKTPTNTTKNIENIPKNMNKKSKLNEIASKHLLLPQNKKVVHDNLDTIQHFSNSNSNFGHTPLIKRNPVNNQARNLSFEEEFRLKTEGGSRKISPFIRTLINRTETTRSSNLNTLSTLPIENKLSSRIISNTQKTNSSQIGYTNTLQDPFMTWVLRLSFLCNSENSNDFNLLKTELLKHKKFSPKPSPEKIKSTGLDSLCKNLFLHRDEETSIASFKCYRWIKEDEIHKQQIIESSKNIPIIKNDIKKGTMIPNNLIIPKNSDTLSSIKDPNCSQTFHAYSNKENINRSHLYKSDNQHDQYSENRIELIKQIEDAIGKKSAIDDFRQQEDLNSIKENIKHLIKLDATEEFKATITSLEIEAWFCTKCKLWMDKINPQCQHNKHILKKGKCKKDFWECLTPLCKQRFFSLNGQKPNMCPKCKESTAYAKSISMYSARKDPILESEKLILTSEDAKHGFIK